MTMLSELLLELKSNQQRGFIWLSGSQEWTSAWLAAQLSTHNVSDNHLGTSLDIIRFSGTPTSEFHLNHDIRTKKFKSYLGRESDVVLFDAFAGLNPDALGALAGTVRIGGVLILISPAKQDWPRYPDPELNRVCVEPYLFDQIEHGFISRLVNILETQVSVIDVNEQRKLKLPMTYVAEVNARPEIAEKIQLGCLTADQESAVKKVLMLSAASYANKSQHLEQLTQSQSFLSRPKLAVVLTADRGRGKSTSLAIIASQLILQQVNRVVEQQSNIEHKQSSTADISIVITCPLADSVSGLLSHFSQLMASHCAVNKDNDHAFWGIIKSSGNATNPLHWRLRFIPPDELGRHLPNADCVLIDEAAAIPIPLLSPIFKHYDYCILATTQNGYEGTGRGFEYKLKPSLKECFNQVEYIDLQQPIRWTKTDQLEPIVNRLLALDSTINRSPVIEQVENNSIDIKAVSRAVLATDIKLTDEIFALLVHAHYRTSPHDLRMMLDSPNIEVWVATFNGLVIGASLVSTEGEIPLELAEKIAQGRRRPRGHLFPQSLLNHSGYQTAGNYLYGRVVRIAIHPELQNRGIGQQLVDTIRKSLESRSFDFICTSFGLTEPLFRFWQRNQFKPVRLGIKPEASSGELSIMMWQSLASANSVFFEGANLRFQDNLLVESKYLPSRLEWLEILLVNADDAKAKAKAKAKAELSSFSMEAVSTQIGPQDLVDLIYLTEHFRLPDNCLLALYRLCIVTDKDDILADWLEGNNLREDILQRYGISGQNHWNETIRRVTCIRMQLL